MINEKKLTGTLAAQETLTGVISDTGNLRGAMTIPKSIVEKNYNELINKPKINSVELIGNRTLDELGIASDEYITDAEIDTMLFGG